MKIFIVDLESVPTRYTCEWKEHIPKLFEETSKYEVVNISGGEEQLKASPGAFLNFAQTNIYKNNQLNTIARMFSDQEIKAGDRFLFTDAWHPGIIELKYMSQLLKIPVEIHAFWHAGSYDPHDFLGRLIPDKRWSNSFEQSLFHAIDYNWYATQFHIDMFSQNVFGKDITWELSDDEIRNKFRRTGWPMEYMKSTLDKYVNISKHKEDIILFPHRIAPEKQIEVFKDLEKSLPQYKWIVCQEKELTKKEYHTLLAKSKIVFSASLQETLGIGCFEGALLGAIPIVPNRLSYVEMYDNFFKYPSEWTESIESYTQHKDKLEEYIVSIMDNYTQNRVHAEKLSENLQKDFFSAGELLKVILR